MDFQIIINGLIAASIYSLIALGFSIIYNTVRFFHLSHGAIYVAGAYIAYYLTMNVGIHPIPAFFLPRLELRSSELPMIV